jgi:uncharacterized protein (TIGR03086 family)
MDEKELFKRAMAQATKVVSQVSTADYKLSTPDTEWNVRRLLKHMLYELSWTADIVRGATIAEVGDKYDGNLIGGNLTAAWRVAAKAAGQAIDRCDLSMVAHLSYADKTVAEYLKEAASDQLIHSWDLGMAIGQKVDFDPAITQLIYDDTLPNASTMSATGLFAPVVKVADDASLQTKLLALYGRDSGWQPV